MVAYIQSTGLITFLNKKIWTLNNYSHAIVGSHIIACCLVPLPKLILPMVYGVLFVCLLLF